MISVIMPLGQRQRHWSFWLVRGAVYIAAATLAGAAVGALAGSAGSLLRAALPFGWLAGPVLVLAVAYGLHELGVWRLPQPERAWQVPNEWIVRRPLLGAAAFGLILGAGVFTFIPFTSFYLVLAWEALVADPVAGAWIGAAYGLARSLPVVSGALVTLRGGSIPAIHLNLLGARPQLHRTTGGFLLLAALALLVPLFL
jgi:hypothetical protein